MPWKTATCSQVAVLVSSRYGKSRPPTILCGDRHQRLYASRTWVGGYHTIQSFLAGTLAMRPNLTKLGGVVRETPTH